VTYRIEWTCTELDEAMLIRGMWWWRRCAMVYRDEEKVAATYVTPDHVKVRWKFRNSDFEVGHELYRLLETARTLAREFGHEDLDWTRHRTKRNTQPFERAARLRLMP